MKGSIRALLATAAMLTMGAPGRAAADADLSRMVVLGDSFAAGYSSGGLRRAEQNVGFARLLARQASSGTFEQPLMTDPGIPAVVELRGGPVPSVAPAAGLGSPVNLTLPRPFDNLAVPGAGVGDLSRTSSDGGGLQDLVLRGLGTQLEQALLLEPTFVSVWVGSNDALRAAVSGVVLEGKTLTPADRFATDFEALLQDLVRGGVAAGAVATVPRVTDLPFVTAVPTRVGGNTADLDAGAAAAPLIGPDGPLEDGDFALLTASAEIARGVGVPKALGGTGAALGDEFILDRFEALRINDRIDAYNRAMRRAAADVGFAVVETAELFERWSRSGKASWRLFSLDGIHPSPAGHRLIANAFLEAIHETYGNRVSLLEPASERTAAFARLAAAGRFVFTARAARSLRFGLHVPRPARLLRLKRKRLERFRGPRNRPLPRFELPSRPLLARVAALGAPASDPA